MDIIDPLYFPQCYNALPFSVDDSYTIPQQIGKLLYKVNELVESTNTYFATDILTHVTTILTSWITNGTLDNFFTASLDELDTKLATYKSELLTTYTGNAGKHAIVNNTETGLIFTNLSIDGGTF